MKKFLALGIMAVMALMLTFSSSKAQNGNCSQGNALGQATALLNDCINGYRPGYEVNHAVSPNQYGGYSVTFWAAPKCPPGAICPLYIFFLGSVDTDASCNIVAVNSVCR